MAVMKNGKENFYSRVVTYVMEKENIIFDNMSKKCTFWLIREGKKQRYFFAGILECSLL